MRKSPVVLVLLLLQIAAIAVWASDIKEADYPVQYEVLMTSKTSKLKVEKDCSMTLRDKAKPNVAINVWRKGYGSCQVLENGKVYRGREDEKKNEIEIVVPVGDTKARVENWRIVGTSDLAPQADRPTS